MGMRASSWFAGATLLLAPVIVEAQPATQTASENDDDATVTLTVRDAAIVDDPRFWCEVEVEVLAVAEPLTVDDTVTISVFEDDLLFDELLFEVIHTVTQQDVDAGVYTELIDCSAPLASDGAGGNWEIFAEVFVDKDACGFLCGQDNPATASLTVAEQVDDADEDDDDMANAVTVVPDTLFERIAADPDWLSVTLVDPGEIEVDLEFMTICGDIDAAIVDDMGGDLAVMTPNASGGSIMATGLAPGDYFVRVAPADPADFNFYDYEVRVTEMPLPATDTGESGPGPGTDSSGGDGTGPAPTTGPGDDSAGGDQGGVTTMNGAGTSDTEDGTDSAGQGGGGGDSGCGCSQRSEPWGPALALLGLVAFVRRRR